MQDGYPACEVPACEGVLDLTAVHVALAHDGERFAPCMFEGVLDPLCETEVCGRPLAVPAAKNGESHALEDRLGGRAGQPSVEGLGVVRRAAVVRRGDDDDDALVAPWKRRRGGRRQRVERRLHTLETHALVVLQHLLCEVLACAHVGAVKHDDPLSPQAARVRRGGIEARARLGERRVEARHGHELRVPEVRRGRRRGPPRRQPHVDALRVQEERLPHPEIGLRIQTQVKLADDLREHHALLQEGQVQADARTLTGAEGQPSVRRAPPGLVLRPAVWVKLLGVVVHLRIVMDAPLRYTERGARRDVVRSQPRRAIGGRRLVDLGHWRKEPQALLDDLRGVRQLGHEVPRELPLADDVADLAVQLLLHVGVRRDVVEQHGHGGGRGVVPGDQQSGRVRMHELLGQQLACQRVGLGHKPGAHVLHDWAR
mmetsp:Transcript_61023/g.186222  ORF Transcript_61023/g.186222 Transcript_61023/m.186222 type:complete len:428 (-) Transcript_61023:857-2140(-)